MGLLGFGGVNSVFSALDISFLGRGRGSDG